jgi:type IV pilus assembly protein PilB
MARKKLGEMLVEAGALTEQGLRMALNEQRRWGGTLGRTLVEMKMLREDDLVNTLSSQLGIQAVDLDEMKLVSEAELVRVLAAQLALPTVDLDGLEIHSTVLELVPGELAEQHSIIPFAQPMKFLDVAMIDPTNLGVIDELRIRTQLNIRPYLAGPKMIERALAKHYRRGFGRTLARRDDDIPLNTGDLVVTPGGAPYGRPDSAEIDAARRREGLRPAPRPSRPPPLEVSQVPVAPSGLPGLPSIELGLPGISGSTRDAEIEALQDRISKLEALVARDEGVLRKVLSLLIEKGVATREEILERIR